MGTQSKTIAGAMLRKKMAATVSPAAAGKDWAELSGHYTELAEARSNRDDLNVICAPEAAMGHPGYYMPATARIALDGDILPSRPKELDTDNPEHFAALAALQGVFVHELGHSVHTDSMREAIEGEESRGSILLEEIRMEAKAIADRPKDAIWLRAASKQLILEGETGQNAPQTKAQAAQVAILTEGRVQAGSLQPQDVAEISKALEAVFDQEEMDEIRSIMQGAVEVEDGDCQAMTDLARRLRELSGEPEGGGEAEGGQLSDQQGEALSDAVKKAAGQASQEAATELIHDAEGGQVDQALDAVEGQGEDKEAGEDEDPQKGLGAPSGAAMHAALRPPGAQEKKARLRLTQLLRKARWRDRDKVKTSAVVPPGRLRSREAMRGSAEKSMGRMPSAKPWKKTRRRHVEQPKLRVGLVVDVSGSMSPVVPTVSSTMWIVANAVHDVGGKAAGYSFGDSWNTVVRSGTPPKQVADFGQGGGTMNPGYAILQAEKDLQFDQPGPRVLVIVSDGAWAWAGDQDLADQAVERLMAQGVVVLSVNIGFEPSEHPSTRTCVLDSVDEIPQVIGGACLAELSAA